ncbi:MAG: tetratricopeptide repeat protein [Terriglobales bacterium]
MVAAEPLGDRGREALRFGPFEVNLREWELRRHGRPVRLQGQPFQILALLLAHPGELVSREDLRRQLWPDHTFVDFDRGLNKAVNKLRYTLGDDADRPRYIATVPRHGYRFIAPVEAVIPVPQALRLTASSLRTAPAAPPPRPSAEVNGAWPNGPQASAVPRSVAAASWAGTGRPAGPRPPAWRLALNAGRRQAFWVAAGVIALAASAGAWLALGGQRFGRPAPLPAPAPRVAVAVLGFRNLSGQPRADWLATALSDWLSTELAAGHQLRLVPQQGVARMRAELHLPLGESLTAGSLARVRRDCGAEWVVAGDYALLGSQAAGPIRLDVVVQDTRTGATLLAWHQNGAATALLALVARAGARLRAGLGVGPVTSAQAAEVRRALPATPAAARAYAEGLAHLRVFDAIAARRWLEQAVAADPGNALAHSALATAWRILGYDQQARAEAARALRLSAGLSRRERLLIQARYEEMSRHWRSAIAIYRALCRFFPDNVEYALALAQARTRAGQGRLALAGLQALQPPAAGTPLPDPRVDLAVAAAQESLGRYGQMRQAAQRAAVRAQVSGASLLLARALNDEAWADENLGGAGAALTAAGAAQRRFAADGDADGVAAALTLQAISASDLGRSAQALATFRRGLAVYRQTGRQDAIAAEWNNIGSTEEALGRPAAAARHFRRARTIYRQVQHPDGVALTTANLGFTRLSAGQTARAQRDFGEALAICRQVGDGSKAALAELGLAQAAWRQGHDAAARAEARRALAGYAAIGDRRSAAQLQLLLARMDLRQQRWAAASSLAATAGRELRREGAIPGQATAQAVQAQVEWRRGQRATAEASLARAQARLAQHPSIGETLYLARVAAQFAAAEGGTARQRALAQLTLLAARAQRMGLVWEARQARRALAALGMVHLAAAPSPGPPTR